MKTPSAKPIAKGGQPLPPGSRNVPGSKAYRKMQGAPHPGFVEIGNDFVSSRKGGPPLVVGRKHIRIKGDPKHPPR
jgi:hypothetical protein